MRLVAALLLIPTVSIAGESVLGRGAEYVPSPIPVLSFQSDFDECLYRIDNVDLEALSESSCAALDESVIDCIKNTFTNNSYALFVCRET